MEGTARGPLGTPSRTQPHPPQAPGGTGGNGWCCAAPANRAGKTEGRPVHIFFFFSATERFPRCVMRKDANMQTLSGIVPAPGEKLKHKSGGGKLRGGCLFKGVWLGRGSRVMLARELLFQGQHFQRVSKASGWEKASMRGGAGRRFSVGSAML